MSLFTTASSQGETGTRPSVVDAIRAGSEKTGAGFDYLLRTAQRESALTPDARNPKSSASGLFQFIEQTWLGTVKKAGAAQGLSAYADAIREVRPGRYEISDPALRTQILGLRNDPAVAALMAGEFTRQNASQLGATIGRAPTEGELYAAHFMGSAGAAELIRRAQTQPGAKAADLFPDQAQANRSIFFDGNGRARSVRQVYDALTVDRSQAIAVPNVPETSSDPSSWFLRKVATVTGTQQPAMHALYRTEGDRGPVNKTVARLWVGPTETASGQASRSPAFFPRSLAVGGDASSAAAVSVASLSAPLPQARPADLSKIAVEVKAVRGHLPLNLMQFAKRRVGA
jgi:hypothetical protein